MFPAFPVSILRHFQETYLTHFLDRILSKPGNPNLIISATRLIPFWGSGGISFLFNSGIGIGKDEVVGGDITATEAAETVPNFGHPGKDSIVDDIELFEPYLWIK